MAINEVLTVEAAPQTEAVYPLGQVATTTEVQVEIVGIPLDQEDVLFLNMPNQFLDQEKAPVAVS